MIDIITLEARPVNLHKPSTMALVRDGNYIKIEYADKLGVWRSTVDVATVNSLIDEKIALIPVGGGSALQLTWSQSVASAHWQIPFNPAWGRPNVTVYDTTGRIVGVQAEIESPGILAVLPSAAFAGYAKLNF